MPPSILNAIEGGGQSRRSFECLHCRSVSLRRYDPVQVLRVWSQSRPKNWNRTPPTLLVWFVCQWYGCLKRTSRRRVVLVWDLRPGRFTKTCQVYVSGIKD